MRRLPRNIGGPSRMVCGCKDFDLVVRFTSFSCKMRAFPILPPSYLFFVWQKRMRSPLMGPNRGMSIGMTALANDNATNFTRNEKKKEKKEDPWQKEKKRKKEDPWKRPNPNQTTHTCNGKRRLRLSAWLTLLVLQVQVKSNSAGHAKALPGTTNRGGTWYAPLRTIAPWHVLYGSFPSPSTLVYSNNGAKEEGLGGETPFAGAARRGCTQDAKRARYPRGGVTCLLVLFVFIVHFFLFAPFFSRTLYICWLVCLGRKGAEELIRRMKERREAKDREEEAKRKESGMCLSHPLCRAVTMAHYGPICA